MAPSSFQIVQRSGPTPGKMFSLTKNEIYVGRDITNDIVINDPEVSRKHARLSLQAGGYVLEDLGSTNGTFVDGQRITGPHLLGTGEVIMLGDNVTLAFEAAGFDPDATVAVSADEVPVPPTPGFEEVPLTPVTAPDPVPQPVYTSQPPPTPEAPPPQSSTSNSRIWLLAGCGCLVLFLCIIAAGLVVFDSLNLYCTPPFDAFLCP